MGLFGQYTYKTKKGERYWLHSKDKGKVRLYFFSKNPLDALQGIPKGYEVSANERTGLPILKKKKKKEEKSETK